MDELYCRMEAAPTVPPPPPHEVVAIKLLERIEEVSENEEDEEGGAAPTTMTAMTVAKSMEPDPKESEEVLWAKPLVCLKQLNLSLFCFLLNAPRCSGCATGSKEGVFGKIKIKSK